MDGMNGSATKQASISSQIAATLANNRREEASI